jgi:hypothetical protein
MDHFEYLKASCNGRMLIQNLQTESEDIKSTNQASLLKILHRHGFFLSGSNGEECPRVANKGGGTVMIKSKGKNAVKVKYEI